MNGFDPYYSPGGKMIAQGFGYKGFYKEVIKACVFPTEYVFVDSTWVQLQNPGSQVK